MVPYQMQMTQKTKDYFVIGFMCFMCLLAGFALGHANGINSIATEMEEKELIFTDLATANKCIGIVNGFNLDDINSTKEFFEDVDT